MSEAQVLSVIEADYKWPDDQLVVRKSDYDALAAERERLREQHEGAESQAEYQRDRAEHFQAERDAALAELAALKGGQEAVAMIRYARGVPGFENEMPHVVSCNDLPDGLYPVYLAPPAQASAWPEGWKLVPVEPTHEMEVAGCEGYMRADGNFIMHNSSMGHAYAAMLAAAPTPGASDGKGGDHSAHDLNMVQVPKDLHLITLGMLSSYVTTLAGIDFPDNDEGDHQQRLNETKRAAVNSAIAKLRALITGSTA